MAVENKVKELGGIFYGTFSKEEKLKELWGRSYSEDFIIKHMSLYLIKLLKKQRSVPLIINRLKKAGQIIEEDKLRLIDILASLKPNSAVTLKNLLLDKNPYVIRGYLTALALSGGKFSLEIIVSFASSGRGRIIKRELVGELVGYILNRDRVLENWFSARLYEDSDIRGYFRDMEIKFPEYGRLNIYPANDYWALKMKRLGLDYSLFKREQDRFKKNVKSI